MKLLDHERITELHDIFLKEYGRDLAPLETADAGERLVRYFDLLIAMDRENNAANINRNTSNILVRRNQHDKQ